LLKIQSINLGVSGKQNNVHFSRRGFLKEKEKKVKRKRDAK